MTDSKTPQPAPPLITHKSSGIPTVWLVPIVAAVIGGWLLFKHFSEAGVPIDVTFKTASGIEAGKTKVKYKDIQVGLVNSVEISDDLESVQVGITMDRNAKPYLREQTEFWVVQPRVGPGGITGLGTIISGAYLNMRLGGGKDARKFTGLEQPPVASDDVKGVRLILTASQLGSLGPAVPIFFRGVRVGEVEETKLDADGSGVEVHAIVEAPYDRFVRTSSHFWNASGIEVDLSSAGFALRTESIASIIAGGLAFDSPTGQGALAKTGDTFVIFPDYEAAALHEHPERGPFFVLYPPGPTRGLSVGGDVTLEGVVIGEVTSVQMEYAPEFGIRTPVKVRLEPSKVKGVHPDDAKEVSRMIQDLVERGLRAQLASGSLLTGELYVDLSFHPDVPVQLVGGTELPELPTVPSALQNLEQKAGQFLDQLAAMPLDALIADTQAAVTSLHTLIEDLDGKVDPLVAGIDGVTDEARKTLAAATEAITTIESGVAPDSAMYYDLATTLEELSAAARSIRVLAGYLERHPNALIMGKSKTGGQ